MKSKFIDLAHNGLDIEERKKTMPFINLYKSSAQPSTVLNEKLHLADNANKGRNVGTKNLKKSSSNIEQFVGKSRKKVIDDFSGSNVSNATSLSIRPNKAISNKSKLTYTGKKQGNKPNIRSIMKTSDSSMENRPQDISPSGNVKRKKRNKSVSFMVDENDEVVLKKSRAGDTDAQIVTENNNVDKPYTVDVCEPSTSTGITDATRENSYYRQKRHKKAKTRKDYDKQIFTDTSSSRDTDFTSDSPECAKPIPKKKKGKYHNDVSLSTSTETDTMDINQNKDKRNKKSSKLKEKIEMRKCVESCAMDDNEVNVEADPGHKQKFNKKHKTISQETDEEPRPKSRKKDIKVIAEDLGNLKIGDNAHTLSNMLDEMSVVDKKKKKLKKHKNKTSSTSPSSSETADLEKIDEEKEKVKWKKRKWNKDKRADLTDADLHTSIIVENLPLKIMINYRKLLTDHFSKYGLIKKIGTAELYPTEEPEPIFTATVYFYSDGATTKALEEDGAELEGSRLRVRRPLPLAQSTLVVRSYAELGERALAAAFLGCGRIRSVKHIVKGKKSIGTAFVEFDGPEAVSRALKVAEDARIGGKKVFVSRFEVRRARAPGADDVDE